MLQSVTFCNSLRCVTQPVESGTGLMKYCSILHSSRFTLHIAFFALPRFPYLVEIFISKLTELMTHSGVLACELLLYAHHWIAALASLPLKLHKNKQTNRNGEAQIKCSSVKSEFPSHEQNNNLSARGRFRSVHKA